MKVDETPKQALLGLNAVQGELRLSDLSTDSLSLQGLTETVKGS